jgi:transmembrane sensor
VTRPWAGGPTCTASGQRRSFTLDDGSRLGLNSHSAVDLLFDADQRLLVLRRGELLIQVAADPQRPLRVRTAQGQVQALGTRFLVSQEKLDPCGGAATQRRASLADGRQLDLQEGQAACCAAAVSNCSRRNNASAQPG